MVVLAVANHSPVVDFVAANSIQVATPPVPMLTSGCCVFLVQIDRSDEETCTSFVLRARCPVRRGHGDTQVVWQPVCVWAPFLVG